MWEAIKDLTELGCREFHLGRTEHENTGLRKFKRGWGAKEYDIKYYRYHFGKNEFVGRTFVVPSMARDVMRRLPVSLLQLIGRALYKHIG
jgi:hypothetical protein